MITAYNLILPVGTQVVTQIAVKNKQGEQLCIQGAVGVITQAPTDNSHSYQIQLPDETTIALKRHEFSIRKHFQQPDASEAAAYLAEYDLNGAVIYRCIVGSRAFGLDHPGSDTDRRGIYLPPAALHWSLYGIPEQLDTPATQECYWELQKFLVLALKANPNVLECLYTPLVETATPLAQELLDQREMFLSKLVYQTYNGYVLSQFKKMEQDLRNQGQIRPKHAMHLIRLLLSGITILKEGFVPVNVVEYRDELLAIRDEQMSWEEMNQWRLALHQRFDRALETTHLSDRPDYEAANAFLIHARAQQARAYEQ
ncbi:MAG: nucleotidyltransferase domain-containing protein [Spirulina sp. SIO3F2]|nr:nucleotidyltransferase domain-containing protein [Spirulina sp. SIO3F2]